MTSDTHACTYTNTHTHRYTLAHTYSSKEQIVHSSYTDSFFSFLRVWLRPGPGLASTNSTESTWKCCLSLLSRYVIVCYCVIVCVINKFVDLADAQLIVQREVY